MKLPISRCTKDDYLQILADVEAFWGSTRTVQFHHPMFVHEFGNTAFVIRDGGIVVAYLFGFFSQTENAGYVHLAAVRESHQRKGLAKLLYTHFIDVLKKSGVTNLKAITTPENAGSIAFHSKLGMTMTDGDNEINIVKDYSGYGQSRIVFKMPI